MARSNGGGETETGNRTDPELEADESDPRGESDRIATEDRRRNAAFVSGVVAVVGAWVIVSIFLVEVGEATAWNNALVGSVVVLAAGYNAYRVSNDQPLSAGLASFVALLGLWLLASTVLLGMTDGAFVSTAAAGALVAGLAAYDAYEGRKARAVATDRETID